MRLRWRLLLALAVVFVAEYAANAQGLRCPDGTYPFPQLQTIDAKGHLQDTVCVNSVTGVLSTTSAFSALTLGANATIAGNVAVSGNLAVSGPPAQWILGSNVQTPFSGTVDNVLVHGYNTLDGATKQVGTEPLARFGYEQDFNDGTRHNFEWNFDLAPTISTTPNRFMLLQIDRTSQTPLTVWSFSIGNNASSFFQWCVVSGVSCGTQLIKLGPDGRLTWPSNDNDIKYMLQIAQNAANATNSVFGFDKSVNRWVIDTTNGLSQAPLRAMGGVETPNGTCAAPLHTFFNDTGAGMVLNTGNGSLDFCKGGSTLTQLNSLGFRVIAPIGTTAVTFSALPTCNSGNEGLQRALTDSNTNVWGAAIAGAGANHVLAYCNGTSWTVAAK